MSIETLPKYAQYCLYLGARGHFLVYFGCLERPWGHLGPPVSIFHRFYAKSRSKRGRKWRPFGLFGLLVGHLEPHLEEMGSEMGCPRVPKSDFVDIMKTLIF